MVPEHHLTFGSFRIDPAQGRLWQGAQVIGLRPRSLAVLRYLVEHPGRLVTKAELRQHVWAGTYVSDTVLRVCVQEIRAALGDVATAPRYLETVGRQGYRFQGGADRELPVLVTTGLPGPIIGRQHEVEALERWFQQAAHGARQVVFVSGDAGVGKTTVLDLWLARQGAGSGGRLAWGQCVEHYGEGEPYLPLLEALGQLCRGPSPQDVLAVLRQYAPLWLAQLPGLLSETERERLQRQVQGAPAARMLRELTDALDVLSAEVPLVLVLEDLQWSDHATVEALAAIAQQRAAARLLVVGTYRPVEVVLRRHPLRGMVQELCGRGRAGELRLELLPAPDVAAYVAGRLGGPVAAGLAAFVHNHTEGNALFMVNMVEHLVQQGLVVQQAGQWTLRNGAAATLARVPEALEQLLRRRIEALQPETRQVLEVASVVGREFAVAAVAAGVQGHVEDVEAQCDALAMQHHFLDDTGLAVWPDGTRGGRYHFQHTLYQQALYQQIGSARREQCHRRIGLRLEAGHGARVREIAAQLAVHFEYGGETLRAVHYWQQTGENAARRNAYHEAIAALRRGLALLATLPDSPERTQRELALQILLGEMFVATQSMASPEAGEAYSRAHALCQGLEETPQHFQVLQGLCNVHRAQARLRTTEALSQQLCHMAQGLHNAVLVLESHLAMGSVAFYLGDLVAARTHLEQSLGLCDTPQLLTPLFLNGYEPGVKHGTYFALVLWLLGYADQAQQRSQEALALAQQIGHTPSLAVATIFAAIFSQFRRDAAATRAHTNALIAAAPAQGFAYRVDQGNLLRGWALAMQEDAATGIALIRQGLVAAAGMSFNLYRPYFLTLLAEAYGQAGQPEAGLTVLDEALTVVATTEERWWEAEVWRLKGELLLRLPLPDVPQATACLHQAFEVARRQQAKALELRVALSLSRLWQQQGKRDQARQLLTEVYSWFTEGFETSDLQEAKALLQDLGA
jgi:predicted ATPase/DNA-binding winged helix-turn-helix (wHTH) protein